MMRRVDRPRATPPASEATALAPPSETGVLDPAVLVAWQPFIKRSGAWLILFTSFAGAVITCNGGYEASFPGLWPWMWTISLDAVLWGCLLQFALTALQYIFCRRYDAALQRYVYNWRHPIYILAVAGGAGTSLYAYTPLLAPAALALLLGVGDWIGWLIEAVPAAPLPQPRFIPLALALPIAYTVTTLIILWGEIAPERTFVRK